MAEVEMDDDTRDRFRIERARVVARLLRKLGWAAAALGCLALLAVGVFYLTGDMSGEKAWSLATGSVFASLLSGVVAYGSGMNLTLSASRLERVLPPEPTAGADEGDQDSDTSTSTAG